MSCCGRRVMSASMPECANSVVARRSDRSVRRPVVCDSSSPMCEPMSSGGTMSRVQRSMRARSTGSLQSDAQRREVRPRMPRSTRPPPDAHVSISRSGNREPSSSSSSYSAHVCACTAGRCGSVRRVTGSSSSRLWSHLMKSIRYLSTRPAIASSRYAYAAGFAMSSTYWWRAAGPRPARGPRIQSGCSRARSESRLTISGSNQRPNCMPSARTTSTNGSSPSGHTPSSICQSPRPASSARRPRNQPSSSTTRSTPTAAPARASAVSRSRSCAKYTASHVFSTSGRGRCGCAARDRTCPWNRRAMPSRPSSDQTK